VVIGRQR
ncbi:phage minor tail L family protein, partial [Escherichia coli EC1848]